MPVPKPEGKERKRDFISRFMSDPNMRKEFPDQKQRVAVAYSQTRRKAKGRKK